MEGREQLRCQEVTGSTEPVVGTVNWEERTSARTKNEWSLIKEYKLVTFMLWTCRMTNKRSSSVKRSLTFTFLRALVLLQVCHAGASSHVWSDSEVKCESTGIIIPLSSPLSSILSYLSSTVLFSALLISFLLLVVYLQHIQSGACQYSLLSRALSSHW